MDEIEEVLIPTDFVKPSDFVMREQRLIKALRCAIQQRDKQFETLEEPDAKKKKTIANREVLLFLKGVIQ